MNETLTLCLVWLSGGALGAIFFCGLLWTVRKATASEQPAAWFFGSLILRTSLALAWFYFVSNGDWKRLLLCLLGFVMARVVVTWITRPSKKNQNHPEQEERHAS